jgi:uncharacterized damage-inducible protein DinB
MLNFRRLNDLPALVEISRRNVMAKLTQLIEEYLAGPKTLRAAVAGMSREQLLARPITGKMSTLEVVAHLTDFDPIYADRMKRVIAEEQPRLIGADENRFKDALAYHERDLEEEISIIEKTRSQFARILRKLPDSALQRVGVHDERGELSLENLLTTITGHIHHHVKFIREKRQALGLK